MLGREGVGAGGDCVVGVGVPGVQIQEFARWGVQTQHEPDQGNDDRDDASDGPPERGSGLLCGALARVGLSGWYCGALLVLLVLLVRRVLGMLLGLLP